MKWALFGTALSGYTHRLEVVLGQLRKGDGGGHRKHREQSIEPGGEVVCLPPSLTCLPSPVSRDFLGG